MKANPLFGSKGSSGVKNASLFIEAIKEFISNRLLHKDTNEFIQGV